MPTVKITAFALTVALCSRAANVGVADSPLPAPFTQHVFTVPGVIDSNLGTFFSCTNLDAVSVTIGVKLFGPAGGARNEMPVPYTPGARALLVAFQGGGWASKPQSGQ